MPITLRFGPTMQPEKPEESPRVYVRLEVFVDEEAPLAHELWLPIEEAETVFEMFKRRGATSLDER